VIYFSLRIRSKKKLVFLFNKNKFCLHFLTTWILEITECVVWPSLENIPSVSIIHNLHINKLSVRQNKLNTSSVCFSQITSLRSNSGQFPGLPQISSGKSSSFEFITLKRLELLTSWSFFTLVKTTFLSTSSWMTNGLVEEDSSPDILMSLNSL